MWECPTCGRRFKNTNQDHSCKVRSLDEHLRGKNSGVIESFQLLHEFALNLDDEVRCSPVKNAILYSHISSFLAVKLRKSNLQIEFLLEGEFAAFPIYKTQKVSKTKYCHFIKMDHPDEVTNEIKNWIKEAYQISLK
jgi:predicted transport protein